MTNEEQILERIERLENEIAPMARAARSMGELREELTPRVNEAVQALIVELADVESDFQIEDLLFLIKKAMRNVRNLNFTLDQLQNLIDFAQTAEPLMKSTVPQIIYYLDDLERKGLFQMATVFIDVMTKIGESHTPEDMEQIGDGMVELIGILKKLTAPEALALLDKAADLPTSVDISHAKPVGPMGMFWRLGDPDVKEGMGVLLELSKGLGALKG